MNDVNLRLVPLPGFTNWTYGVQETTPGFEQVILYRDTVLKFTAPATSQRGKMQEILIDVAARMEFDIQRRFSLRLYGFDTVRTGKGILADMANENVSSFLAQHAVSLTQIGVQDCGILLIDVFNFLKILEEERMQILAIESYVGTHGQSVTQCGEMWRIDDMRTPTPASLWKNLASVRNLFLTQQIDNERQAIYSFIIDSRDVAGEMR